MRDTEQGFIAVTSAIVISALLIIIGASLGYTGFFSRFNIFDGELKNSSLALAEACAEIARVEIANNSGFTAPSSPYTIVTSAPQQYCRILSVAPSGANYTVQTQATYPETGNQRSYSTLQVVYNRGSSDVTVTSWKEIP